MRFPSPLVPARLLQRYKRFLADVTLESDGREVVVHCPNPGAMLGLAEPGMRIWVEPNEDPKKKLNFGWRLVELGGGHLAGIDTTVPNRVVGEALRTKRIAELSAYPVVRAEVPYGTGSRVDFVLSAPDAPDVYVEVKNVHLRRNGTLAEFPDCVTARGKKHLAELAEIVRAGKRAVMFYLVQRTDCNKFALADDLDPSYASTFDSARAAGVEVLVYGTTISQDGVEIAHAIAMDER